MMRTRRTTRRALLAGLLSMGLVSSTCVGGSAPVPGAPEGAPTLREMAEALGSEIVERLRVGYVPGRSGEVVLVTEPWNTVAQWPGGLRGEADPRTTHGAPWDYLMRVPIVLRGPGHVRSGMSSERSVEVTDLAATFADLLGFDFDAPDGRVLHEALLPRDGRNGPPALVVLVVHDGGGWNVLERWPRAWPNQRRLSLEGVTYTNATVGSAPPVTAPVHANMGTGAHPRDHGLPENTGRRPDGEVSELYFHEGDPRLLDAETVGDAWDRANDNRPWVGMVGYEPWHLGMMGHGAQAAGGDRDVAVLWEREEERLWSNEEFYRVPEYLPGRSALDRHLRELDARDGRMDGRWRGNDLTDPLLIPGTPAFVAYQAEVLLELVRREPIGRDDLTDLLFVELKPSDTAGHLWNMENPEVRDVLEEQDRALGDLVSLLDREVGPESYVVMVSADHGQTPHPNVSGGLRVDRFRVIDRVHEYFGAEVLEAVHPDDLYVRRDVLRDRGIAVEEVARFVATLRYRDVAPEGTDLASLPDEVRSRRVFAAAIPGSFLLGLSPEEVRDLGPSAYPEGELTRPRPIRSLEGS